VPLGSHLRRHHLPDADVGAAEHLGHVLHGVQGDADSGPDVRHHVGPEPEAGSEAQGRVSVRVKGQRVPPVAEAQPQRSSAGRTECDDGGGKVVGQVTQTHRHTCRGHMTMVK